MSDYLFLLESRLSLEQWQVVADMEEAADRVATNLYLTGGAIRDLIAGLPIDDLDFVLEGKISKLIRELKKKKVKILSENVGLQTAEFLFPSGAKASVSMARGEPSGKKGRGSKVSVGTITSDLKSRDFAMNAIAISLNRNSRGLLIDPANGIADIQNRQIRSLHNYVFLDEPVRLFRAVRFRARLGFEMNQKTAAQMENAASEGVAEQAVGESLSAEVQQWARERNPLDVLKLLDKEKFLQVLCPRLTGKNIDWKRLTKVNRAVQHLMNVGLMAPSYPLFMYLFTKKLHSRDRKNLYKRLKMKKSEIDLPTKLESAAKKVARQLQTKAANKPSFVYELLKKVSPDILLLLLINYPPGKIQTRVKAHLEKYLPLRARLPWEEVIEMGIPENSPKLQKIMDELFFSIIEGIARTPNQKLKLLKKLVEQAL